MGLRVELTRRIHIDLVRGSGFNPSTRKKNKNKMYVRLMEKP